MGGAVVVVGGIRGTDDRTRDLRVETETDDETSGTEKEREETEANIRIQAGKGKRTGIGEEEALIAVMTGRREEIAAEAETDTATTGSSINRIHVYHPPVAYSTHSNSLTAQQSRLALLLLAVLIRPLASIFAFFLLLHSTTHCPARHRI